MRRAAAAPAGPPPITIKSARWREAWLAGTLVVSDLRARGSLANTVQSMQNTRYRHRDNSGMGLIWALVLGGSALICLYTGAGLLLLHYVH